MWPCTWSLEPPWAASPLSIGFSGLFLCPERLLCSRYKLLVGFSLCPLRPPFSFPCQQALRHLLLPLRTAFQGLFDSHLGLNQGTHANTHTHIHTHARPHARTHARIFILSLMTFTCTVYNHCNTKIVSQPTFAMVIFHCKHNKNVYIVYINAPSLDFIPSSMQQ